MRYSNRYLTGCGRERMPMTSRDQVERMLTLVPYLRNRNQIPVSEVADAFGLTVRQIVLDLHALWLCGLLGGMPGVLGGIALEARVVDGVVPVDTDSARARR